MRELERGNRLKGFKTLEFFLMDLSFEKHEPHCSLFAHF